MNPITIISLSLTHIRIDGGTQTRVHLNEDIVGDYAEALTGGAKLPPVVVFNDGSENWLADGYHRFFAHKKAGEIFIDAEQRDGTLRDAILFSVGANAAHGLRRSNEDKRRAVEVLLGDDEWRQWSNSEIARRCGVSDKTVAAIRDELSSEIPKMRTVQRNGKTYQQDTANIGSNKPDAPKQKVNPPTSDDESLPAKPDVPATEVDALRADLAELKSQYDELLSQYEEAVADNASMSAVFEADDKLVEALAEAKKSRELYRIEKERNTGLMNENTQLKRLVKSWRSKAEKVAA